MSILSINFSKEGDVCSIELDKKRIGDITIHSDHIRMVMILFYIHLNDEYRGEGYFPRILDIAEEDAREIKCNFMILQWALYENIGFFLKKGFRKLNEQESADFCIPPTKVGEINLIKDLSQY